MSILLVLLWLENSSQSYHIYPFFLQIYLLKPEQIIFILIIYAYFYLSLSIDMHVGKVQLEI